MMRQDIGEARIRLPNRIGRGQVIQVHSIISHPMDTGFFRTPEGAPIPAWFIREVEIVYAGRQVGRFRWTSGISRDPVISFHLVADVEGPLLMRWTDSKGSVFEQTAQVAFSAT